MSGISKNIVRGPWHITRDGIAGDAQGDRKHHGGPEKALHHYPREHYAAWSRELREHPLLQNAGAFGETLSTIGWTEENVCIGDVVRFGSVVLQVNQGRQPCFRLNLRFGREDMAVQVQHTGRPGWYYHVAEPGVAAEGSELTLVDRPQPDWPISRIVRLLYFDIGNDGDFGRAADITELAEGWRVLFRRRLESGKIEDWQRRLDG